ncbi:MAG: tetratricopeptide repeat protein, partial [Chloroflexi bacterium]|nr:tetratricopeptide repeat protein [Chloroflexota bacterium]
MAKVSLRVYNREIESLIEGGQFPEAVAHCLHILRTYPMHLETYRLLGKAFLEGKKFANAADIFQRVLTAVPDDFVSHVGMSIINDDENRLDEAIWHMERAFEVQPSNPGITAELKRLYGRREGVEPPKIRLTRDALANMYTQGELYNQAIAEIRSVLSEDPNRPDLQIMLARAYFRGGQKVQATEMCSALLKRFKYCLDALRILVEILPGTGRAENVPAYRQRVIALDPYAAYVSGSVFQSDQVQDAAVGLERLEYDGSTALPQLDWASSLGIHLDEESSPAAIPDWLNVPEDELQHGGQGIAQPAGPDEVEVPAGGEAIPDFMKDAGWQPSTSDGQEAIPPLPLGGETGIPAASPAVPAEIPDWIKSMAP